MSDAFLFYALGVGILVLFLLGRAVRRLFKNLRDEPKDPALDRRALAFVDPTETAPYWLMIAYLQLGVGAAMLYVGMTFRVWWVALVVALLTYAALALFLRRVLFIQILTFGYFSFIDPQKERPSLLLASKTIGAAAWWGDILVGVLIYVPAWILLYRAEVGPVVYFAVGVIPYFTVTVLHHTSAIALRTPRPPWIPLGAAVVCTPFLCAWLAGSFAWWLKSSGRPLVDSVQAGAPARPRGNCEAEVARWEVGGRPMRVAVALSGGGYRAAAAHAGLLAALDEQCVPIDYLTTVSGGSIVGAAYALGIAPSAFVERLRESRPGLPNDLLSFSGVMREWVLPWSSNTEVYSDHFRRTFFDKRTLADLPERPRLLVNATELESGGYEPREVFFKGRAPALRAEGGQTLDQTTYVADIVAASGAFPGAFQPMRLRWVSDDAAATLKDRKFVDGGVIENLGLEGLRRYLTLGTPPPDRPDVLIVSDASQYSVGVEFKRKVELVRLLARSQNLSYEALHRQLYARYTGRTDFWNWSRREPPHSQVSTVPYGAIDVGLAQGAPEHLVTVVIPLTSPSPSPSLAALAGCELAPGQSIAVVQKQVSAFDTLNELEAEEAAAAYWLGYNLGRLYSGAIGCARSRVVDPSSVCELPPSAAAIACRPLAEILPGK